MTGLVCYTLGGEPPVLRPAPHERAWMDATPNRFAYRCLPLNMANGYGWQIINPTTFRAVWNGQVSHLDSFVIQNGPQACSHFGSGILTFHVNGIFRTDPGFNLLVTGPLNEWRDYCHPMSGVVETDWASATFTMNWKFTHANKWITFKAGDPICTICPVRRGELEAVEPKFAPIESDPAAAAEYAEWSAKRNTFNDGLKVDQAVQKLGWQKDYMKGKNTGAGAAPETVTQHQTKMRLRSFAG